jgi:predicted DsbA family dithiol-disulfide isomerase
MQEKYPHQAGAQKTLQVEIYADLTCPWCYIGKKRLEAAFSARPDISPHFVWRAFLLNPTMPREGMDRSAYLYAKFGHSAPAVYGRIAAAGLDSGVEFNFDAITRTPDSRAAHRMLLALEANAEPHTGPHTGPYIEEFSEALYAAYFLQGLDIGDMSVLEKIATRYNRPDLIAAAQHDAIDRQLENNLAVARQLRIDGVPYFVFDGKYSIAGAHLPEHLLPAIDAAAVNL